jgi:hypothetical protein
VALKSIFEALKTIFRLGLGGRIFFFVHQRDKNGHWGWPDLSLLAVGVDRGHPQWLDLSFFFFFFWFARKVVGDGGE